MAQSGIGGPCAYAPRTLRPDIYEKSSLIRVIWVLICSLLTALPFCFVDYPPITDLPQQVAQIRLLSEALENPDTTPYKIQWINPYNLVYLVLGTAVWLFGYANAGRFAMMTIAILSVVSIHYLAYKRDRPPESAALAGLFVFSHPTYLGLYSFALGMPIFVVWFIVVTDRRWGPSGRKGLQLTLLLGLLYFCHLLWFAAGLGWMLVCAIMYRWPLRKILFCIGWCTPWLFLTGWYWYHLPPSPYSYPSRWVTTPFQRASWLITGGGPLGCIKGWLEPATTTALLAWIIWGIADNGRSIFQTTDKVCLLFAFIAFGGCLFLIPDRFDVSILLWLRWISVGAAFLLLGAPAPSSFPAAGRHILSFLLVVTFVMVTSISWMEFEHDELSGLKDTLDNLPSNSRVIGLDFMRTDGSNIIRHLPFLQIYSYAQALKGGRLNFSFVDIGRCLVVWKVKPQYPWTVNLEWYPNRVKPNDFDYFDYAIIGGRQDIHDLTANQPQLRPVTRTGNWRLYRIVRPES